jgi:hypothetical protein
MCPRLRRFRRSSWGSGLLLAAIAALGAGCGVDVDITGGETAACDGRVTYQVKLTNVSACPLVSLADAENAFDFAFLPLVPAEQLEENMLLDEVCGSIGAAHDSNLAAGWFIPMDLAHAVLASTPSAAVSATCTGTGVSCFDLPDTLFSTPGVACQIGSLAPDEMIALSCEAQAGSDVGSFFNPAIAALIASGVCKAGPGQGSACIGSSDCGDGGTCGGGICEGGNNDGNGCDTTAMPSECPGGACVDCSSNGGFGVDCSQTVVEPCAVRAPAASSWGLALMVAVVFGTGGLTLRRLRAARRSLI